MSSQNFSEVTLYRFFIEKTEKKTTTKFEFALRVVDENIDGVASRQYQLLLLRPVKSGPTLLLVDSVFDNLIDRLRSKKEYYVPIMVWAWDCYIRGETIPEGYLIQVLDYRTGTFTEATPYQINQKSLLEWSKEHFPE